VSNINNEWGLTERGFRRPTHTELLDALEYKARELWGTKANLTVRSPLGIFLRIFAWALNILFQVIEDVYNSRFIDTAVGASLYNIGALIGMRLLSARKAVGYELITGPPGTTIPEGWLVATVAGIQFVVVSEMRIGDNGTVEAPIRAVVAGPEGNVAAGTIKEIVNPYAVNGIVSVTNPEATEGGAERETDEDFRDRYYKTRADAGGVNAEAILADVLQNVDGIMSGDVNENYKDTWDHELGLPPHSFEIIAYGGLDTDIAKRIYKKKAFGIQPYGNTIVPVIAANGRPINIGFSRPAPVPIWVKIKDLETDSSFASDGIQQIQQAVIAYIGDDVNGGLGIGKKLYFYRLPEYVNAVKGVLDYTLQISTDGITWGTDNVAVDIREKVVTDASKVVVTR